jgi:GT2 family glycosyltransferase
MVVWLVIASYRNDESVLGILEQTLQDPGSGIFERILVVDSEGTGVVPRRIEERGWRNVIYRSYEHNLGSGANLCERLRLAAEGGADYAYAINHDAYFDPNVVSRLLACAASQPDLGAIYPLGYLTNLGLYNLTGTQRLPLPARLAKSRPASPLLDVYWSTSNGALYSMDPTRRGIVPWDAMWMAWEDLEYGWRLNARGYRQVIVCDAIFRDTEEYSRDWFGRALHKPAFRTYYFGRNLLLAVRRSRNAPIYYLVAFYRLALEAVVILLAKPAKGHRLRLLLAGAIAGLRYRHVPSQPGGAS